MAIRVALQHRTEYNYDRPILLSPQVVRLRPAPHCRTPIRSYSLKVDPSEHFLNWQQDPQGNYLARLTFPKRTQRFCVEVDLIADLFIINPFDFFLEDAATKFPFSYDPSLAEELRPYRELITPGPLLQAFIDSVPRDPKNMNDFLVELNQRLEGEVDYLVRMEPGVQSPEETLTKRSGSCRDTAWLLIQILRHLGFAARFVSGYLIQLAPDQRPLTGPPGPLRDFTDLHAWAEVYLPGAGWVGLDPTSGLFAGEGHIPLACTPAPTSAAPITGLTEPAETEFSFHMDVRRLLDAPRSTKPIVDSAWADVCRLAERIDSDLQEFDVRLTMGGEPTFVSADDRESLEWHTDAVGEQKWDRALDLFDRLSKHFAKGPLHYSGQGKWYPGESLPRWSLECYWSRDNNPLWRDPALQADQRKSYGYGADEAKRFVEGFAEHIGVDPAYSLAGYEDVFYYLWRERRLPVNVDPLDSKLDDPEERARLLRVFSKGLGSITGYALPLRPRMIGDGAPWESGKWFLREDRMYLIPGDASMGYRLPLDSLAWEPPTERQAVVAADPMAIERQRQPRLREAIARLQGDGASGGIPVTRGGEMENTAAGTIRTAICVEPRNGRLYVFIPPLQKAEHYFDLIGAIEKTAGDMSMPVVVEGYKPPSDPRLVNFSIQPDPGVIEVNIHPAANWKELQNITETLYSEARHAGLTTEKFGMDGRVQATGGGGHIVLGGPSAQESPFVRRPDLIKSLVSFWHNHPGLSYLFSGLFIGPTSQSPRMDEGRRDAVQELEIAFGALEREERSAPWTVDRALRNLLVDATGNTHRAEFCIDKLFSTDSPEGRRGLLELRGFEMPPHPRMNLLQQVFVRGCVSHFWRHPYAHPLVRWTTALYDRFMLPHFIWEDFKDALGEIERAGYTYDPSWFDAQFEFRFPKLGEIAHDGVHIELRGALEPWHVLGETGAIGGTVRYVDSSADRIQVVVQGLTESRHKIACNGRELPLHPTGVSGEFVCGVRFQAWQPPVGFHPTLPAHTPLVFDIVDTWADKAVGGCSYWATHPGGRNYELFPVNKEEAETRRRSRFAPIGHTPGHTTVLPISTAPESPMTLDFRRIGKRD